MKNKLRRALLEREVTLGSWIQIGHPACAEVMARAGFDWVCVDLEHGAIDLETTSNIFRMLGAFDCVPVARLPLNDPIWIHRTLDAGARGLIIPMVKTAAEAESAVREAKYPPRGVRGFGYRPGIALQRQSLVTSTMKCSNNELAVRRGSVVVGIRALLAYQAPWARYH